MRRDKLIKAVLVVALVVLSASYAYATEEFFFARVNGFQEIGALAGPTGAIRSNATGTMHLTLDKSAGTATWTLTYTDVGTTQPLTGTVTQAHIHFGKKHVAGGVLVFFCSNLATPPPGGAQGCPNNSGTITGTFSAANVQAIAGQNVTANDFDALVDALESNTAYANIHTTALGAGEIRGQIHRIRRDRDDKDHDDKDHHR